MWVSCFSLILLFLPVLSLPRFWKTELSCFSSCFDCWCFMSAVFTSLSSPSSLLQKKKHLPLFRPSLCVSSSPSRHHPSSSSPSSSFPRKGFNLPSIQMCTMFLKRAMRYYRVWIYCCNFALLTATLVFVILLIWFLTDIHMSLFPSVSLYHPSFIYGFLALILQGGVIQVSNSRIVYLSMETMNHIRFLVFTVTLVSGWQSFVKCADCLLYSEPLLRRSTLSYFDFYVLHMKSNLHPGNRTSQRTQVLYVQRRDRAKKNLALDSPCKMSIFISIRCMLQWFSFFHLECLPWKLVLCFAVMVKNENILFVNHSLSVQTFASNLSVASFSLIVLNPWLTNCLLWERESRERIIIWRCCWFSDVFLLFSPCFLVYKRAKVWERTLWA